MNEKEMENLKAAILQRRGDPGKNGNYPFEAVLVDINERVLLEAKNTVKTRRDANGHVEPNLVRTASRKFLQEQLAGFILVKSTEPCAMCAGAIQWSMIGRELLK